MQKKKPISHIVAGLIIGCALAAFRLILYFGHIDETGAIAWLPIFVMVAGLIVFVNMYGNAMNNEVSFGNLFSYGFKATAIMIIIAIAFTIFFLLLFPDAKEQGFELARKRMEEKGTLTQDQIDKSLEMARKMFWVFAIGGILLIYAIVGAVGSLIGAAVTKKKPVNPHNQFDF